MSLNNSTYEKRVQNLLSFETDDEKLDFETEIIHIDIINQIINIMEERNLSKADLAKALGTSKSYITQLFSGDKILNIKLLAKFQRVFNIKFKISCKLIENIESNILFKSVPEENFKFDAHENKVINMKDYKPLSNYICV